MLVGHHAETWASKLSERKTQADQRFEIHVTSEGADIGTTIAQSRRYLKTLIFIRGALASLRQLLHGLDEEIATPVALEHDENAQEPSRSCKFHDK
jgi:hypothetical protein